MRSRDAIPSLVVVVLAAGVGLAQDTPRAASERGPAAEARGARELPDVSLELPTVRWLPRQDPLSLFTLRRLPPGSLVIRYAGIDAFVVRRVQGRLRALWHDTIQDAWDAGVLDDEGYEAALGRMYDALADHRAGGRWWERSWLDSRVEARGGAPASPFEQQVGRRVELRLGPLVLTNELRASVEHVGELVVEPDAARLLRGLEPARLAREHAWLVREERDSEETPVLELGPEDADDPEGRAAPIVRATFELPDPVLLRTRWRVSLRPSVSVRTSGSPRRALRDVRLRATLELFHATKELRFVDVDLVVRYRPDGDEVTVGFEVVLFTW